MFMVGHGDDRSNYKSTEPYKVLQNYKKKALKM